MTDERLAEEYYYKTYPVTLNIGEEERKEKVMNIFLAGLEAGRPQWHDLRKDPNDLPKDYGSVWTNKGGACHDKDGWYDDYGWVNGVIAWCEPKFDEV